MVQCRVRIVGIGEEDGDDDGADRLVLGSPDSPAYGLDDVDLGAPRVDEGDPVEGGNVDAFGQALGVGEYRALVGFDVTESVEPSVAFAGGHLA